MLSRARIATACLVFASLQLPAPAAAQIKAEDLYKARTLVTGQLEKNRLVGFGETFRQVLVKVSGDQTILAEPGLKAIVDKVPTYVTGFSYRDRKEGRQVNDEQGTRDRSFWLTVTFDPAKIDGALHALKRKPWTAQRPRVVVFMRVQNDQSGYLLTSDGARGRDQRDALEAASDRLGLPAILPSDAKMIEAALTADALPQSDPAKLNQAAKSAGGDVALLGEIKFNQGMLGWAADWRMAAQGRTYRWRIKDVSFDDAFRNALAGSAQILSGHGAPARHATH